MSQMLHNEMTDIPWASLVPRYLVPIVPKRMGHYFTDVLIIGGGLAGMRAAQEIDPKLRTIILTKDKVEESNSTYAQGGIASVWDPEDRFDNHIQDTLVAGCDLCDERTVELVVRSSTVADFRCVHSNRTLGAKHQKHIDRFASRLVHINS